ncbi:PBP superfamily domain protein [Ehrlichia chaffeensis str. Heartland]|uniref:Phosphate ABC transporter, periplasmic phosphate-binding protein n=1 Tax=Ehrlichia chaffeensis (strain ATCC CRL-10679 / Arkansas) TaxID=205920 RepID=Q2GFL9_EHRCR|nr:substrate-binding domain-containing protein [Ehrlichia chaffeensis]ABD45076.1 putative phosphate ABC transporter, periplasmic phosphate-binding protein [Ehrlichia chaffeensis str. Arkansas]AHX03995.1 PBP superfamily domain protein [Ehrlichia chaffeensis str. Heartland]AHX05272.1 PBP superfamily domain protein [Ehrlichia chaffeensis str. Jax]AHX06260.1 PBP superfamily domain protein [Ehrlichia chaffeensis str. Liberty]AHX07262.1 PBP superfamily domain protein [Ehrlichia chaffeensis str. Osce
MGRFLLVFLSLITLAFNSSAQQIRVVGSSTAFPFISAIAEEFGRFSDYGTPIIESVGSGMGFSMFCQGVGKNTPDIVMSSRKIKDAEVKLCQSNNINNIIEIIIGYDGIVIANSKDSAKLDFTKKDLFKALSKYSTSNEYVETIPSNNFRYWSEINNRFPNIDIEIYGPYKNTGTYNILVEEIMQDACMNNQNFIDVYSDPTKRRRICSIMRNDGKYIEVAANENIIIQKIAKNQDAFGILSFSFLVKNQDKIHANKIAGIEPNYETISSGKYILSRPIYLYIKQEHISFSPSLKEFIKVILREDSIGKNGYLIGLGFIPLSDKDLQDTKNRITGILEK